MLGKGAQSGNGRKNNMINHGRLSIPVTDDMIDSVLLLSCTAIQNGNDSAGRYILEVSHDTSGCPNPSGFNIYIKDIFAWTLISYTVYVTGTASCWQFNNNNNYTSGTNRILAWNSSLDRVISAKNCWELPQYTLKMSACDNEPTNFFHGSHHTGTFKQFHVTRRRNTSLAGLAGPSHGRTCHSSGGRTIISNIRIS
jgi:hypothetical protein